VQIPKLKVTFSDCLKMVFALSMIKCNSRQDINVNVLPYYVKQPNICIYLNRYWISDNENAVCWHVEMFWW